ncbi:hypothetical protein [Niabella soli]|uniref:Uncharacterized protein n=1 Tax=Niabella soli DSM 19437 TaxID=929713 RepID=W0F2N2_9BACT|nr:hypothetical protein [Niabella soli]AHF17290.1 hypothetical protein NIASO_05275 [Niabella soli DSM 19437]
MNWFKKKLEQLSEKLNADDASFDKEEKRMRLLKKGNQSARHLLLCVLIILKN